MKNKYKTCQRFVICLQFYKSHAFNEVIKYSVNKCRQLFNHQNCRNYCHRVFIEFKLNYTLMTFN